MLRGQSAIEYMVMYGLSLIILVAVWSYVGSANSDFKADLKAGFAKQTVTKIADAANAVLTQGPPAKIYVDINTPEGVVYAYPDPSASCNVSEVLLRISAQQGQSTDVAAPLIANVSGDLSFLQNNPGPKRVWVESIDNNGVPCVRVYGG